jgi:hypothetical protein
MPITGIAGLAAQVASGLPAGATGWQAGRAWPPVIGKALVSTPQVFVFASAQQPGTSSWACGREMPLHSSSPHGTGVGVAVLPAAPELRPAPPWALPPAPAPPTPATLESSELDEFPPQAGAATARTTPDVNATRKARQNMGGNCSTLTPRTRALPAAPNTPPELTQSALRLALFATSDGSRLTRCQARAFLRVRPRSGPPSICTTSSHNSGLFMSAPNSGGCRCPAAASQR